MSKSQPWGHAGIPGPHQMRPPRAQPRMMNPWAGGPAPPDLPRQPGWDHADFAPQYPNNWRGFYPPPPRTVPAWWKPEVAQADPRYYGALPPQPPAQRSFAWRQDPQTRRDEELERFESRYDRGYPRDPPHTPRKPHHGDPYAGFPFPPPLPPGWPLPTPHTHTRAQQQSGDDETRQRPHTPELGLSADWVERLKIDIQKQVQEIVEDIVSSQPIFSHPKPERSAANGDATAPKQQEAPGSGGGVCSGDESSACKQPGAPPS